jgi:hypothetical protein
VQGNLPLELQLSLSFLYLYIRAYYHVSLQAYVVIFWQKDREIQRFHQDQLYWS